MINDSINNLAWTLSKRFLHVAIIVIYRLIEIHHQYHFHWQVFLLLSYNKNCHNLFLSLLSILLNTKTNAVKNLKPFKWVNNSNSLHLIAHRVNNSNSLLLIAHWVSLRCWSWSQNNSQFQHYEYLQKI